LAKAIAGFAIAALLVSFILRRSPVQKIRPANGFDTSQRLIE
jgi:hypothetical protein